MLRTMLGRWFGGDRPTPCVFVFAHSARLNGADRCLLESVLGLRMDGVAVHVVLPFPGPLLGELRERRVQVHVWPFYWWLGKTDDGPLQRAMKIALMLVWAVGTIPLAVMVRAFRADVVYSNSMASPWGAWVARVSGTPHVWHVHEVVDPQIDGMCFLLGRRRSLALARLLTDCFVFASETIAEAYRSFVGTSPSIVLYQPVTVPSDLSPHPTGSRDGPLVLLMLGQVRPTKGQEEAIRALAVARNRGADVQLRIVGSGPAAFGAKMRRLVSALELEDAVFFSPHTVRPWDEICKADLILVASRHEAFGRVAVEAMKLGRPVIGSDSGGTGEVLRRAGAGYLFVPRDVASLADAMCRAFEERGVLGQQARVAQDWATVAFEEARYRKALLTLLLSQRRVAAGGSSQ